MKTTYTNEQLQEAIDAALPSSRYSLLSTRQASALWDEESTARLIVARAFLDNLPETQPPAEKPELEIFEAHGKIWTRHVPGDPMPCDGERKVYILTPKTGESEEPYKASMYAWTCIFKEGDWWGEIIGWRYADEPSVTPPEWNPQVGDVVRLKSGGPLMTTRDIDKDDPSDSWCHWFDGNRSCLELFPTACLEPATKEDAR